MAYGFNRVATPIVEGLSDVSFTITVGALLLGIGIITSDEYEEMLGQIEGSEEIPGASTLGRIILARRRSAELLGEIEPVFGVVPGFGWIQSFFGWEPSGLGDLV